MSLIGLTALTLGDAVSRVAKPCQPTRSPIARAVVCSACRARVGESCRGPTGKRTRPHAERIAAAKAGRP